MRTWPGDVPSVIVGFAQQAIVDVVDESANVCLVDDEGAQLESSNVLFHTLKRITERLESPPWPHTTFVFDFVFEFVFGDVLQTAIRVVDENDFSGFQATLGHDKGADHVIGDDASRIADDVGFAVSQTEELEDVHPAVHTSHDRHVSTGDEGEALIRKR